ncbi:MotA/TolQ/ExbB proton channel family protein [Agrobacterium tumefaciens]|uniref:Biopolymer transporter ExbB n=1 Tax=Pedobacter psychrotolerans TaxID=1843235 RepID=A0A4R2H163_9SPHI|nr:MotA/TolQ/ExbB proton channel family protein [Pedobacter psychrotolerans]NTE00424.1 MotA/TolQ/ExbB proton channel family protein [Agrobacterium tumefaciens]NTE21417.1 MotA/TolQ/ExbB proton channel family protein [Agrobacterium tumefaciens]TCO18203.1 outer membrane transport energization protein ExbB [Pedobacter psychrotolerans]GGE70585.1 biopolymer transporter ExbB [Pedobacter psychrotolerans]
MITLLIQDTTQAIQDTANAVNQALTKPAPEELHFIDLLFKGGWVMIPLAFLAFLALVIFVERYLTIKKATKDESNLMGQIRSYIHSGNLDGAMSLLKNNNSPLSRMLQKGLKRIGRPIKDIEGAIENVGKLEVSKLEKNISILGIVAGIAPMLGFVGTIVGVITIFHQVSIKGAIEIGTISGGLYTKMITSASGLIIGIIAYVLYHILNIMVEKIILKMETDAIDFIDLLEEPSK